MDKVLFVGRVAAKWVEKRGGLWVEVEGEREREREMLRMGEGLEGGWVTDHVGVRADFEVLG